MEVSIMKPIPKAVLCLFIFIWFAATANQAAALRYSEVEKICPLDGTKFKTKLAVSGTQLRTRLDRKPLGFIAAPWPVPVCPTDHELSVKSGVVHARPSAPSCGTR